MLWPLVRRNESSPHESKGWVALIDGLSMPHAFIWAKKLLTSPIAGGWESEVNTLNLRFRAGSGTAWRRSLPSSDPSLLRAAAAAPARERHGVGRRCSTCDSEGRRGALLRGRRTRRPEVARVRQWPIARAATGRFRCVCVAAHEAAAWQRGSAAVARICCLLGGERVACTLPADPGAGCMLQGSTVALSVPTTALARL